MDPLLPRYHRLSSAAPPWRNRHIRDKDRQPRAARPHGRRRWIEIDQ